MLIKILLPILLLFAIGSGVTYFINTETSYTTPDADMLLLGNFAFQEHRFKDALKWYTQAALEGKSEAQVQLAYMYERGQGTDKDLVLALHWMEKAAPSGSREAKYHYANMLEFGRGLPQPQPDKALTWYKKAAKLNNPEAMVKVAKMYSADNKDADKQYKALIWSIKAETFPATSTEAKLLIKQTTGTLLQNAKNGSSNAQFDVALMYKKGLGLAPNIEKNEYWLTQAAQQGHTKAQVALGKLYALKKSNNQKALFWLTKAAENGSSQAGYILAALQSIETRDQSSNPEAWRWLYHGMRKRDSKALYNLAVILYEGRLGLPKSDTHFAQWLGLATKSNLAPAQNDAAVYNILQREDAKRSLQWLEEAANQGDTFAQFNLGLLHARGETFTPNDEKADYWWILADKNGNEKASMMLALFYHLGRSANYGVNDAISWYKKAATHNNDALFNMAMIYYKGEGVQQDYKQAANYLKQLANKNDTQAQNLYASLLLEGKGVEFSPSNAIGWFTKAANLGDVLGMFNLATQYRSGSGVAQDDKKALFWYSKAAEHNYAPAQNAIGYLYAEGRGTKKDVDAAEAWFFKASDNGLRLADKNLDALRHNGNYSLITLQIETKNRDSVLTAGHIDLAQWLEVHHQPLL